jgi:hypothetical protein
MGQLVVPLSVSGQLQDPLIAAVATPPISIHYAIVDSTALSAVLPDLRGL